MKLTRSLLAGAVLTILGMTAAHATNDAAAPSTPTRGVQTFLDKLKSGTGKPIEQLSPADARQVLIGARSARRCRPRM